MSAVIDTKLRIKADTKKLKAERKQRVKDAHTVELVEELVYRRGLDWELGSPVAELLRGISGHSDEDLDIRHRAEILLAGFGAPCSGGHA